jgi:MFS transporter, OCT family, solute carrier family 22 (organic cation transporter), member 4/5
MDNKYDEIINRVGQWGKYQLTISIIVILTSMSVPMTLLILPMMQKEPNFTYNNTAILDKEAFCSEIFYTQPFDIIYNNIQIDPSSMYNWASELKIVCSTRKILAIVGTVFFLASITSNLAFSKFPDVYGRKRVFLVLNFISFLSILQLLYLRHLGQLILAAFLNGLSSLNLALGSVIINENIHSKYSGIIMGLTNAVFPLGGIINTLFIYFFKDWRFYLIFNIIIFATAVILGFLYMQESPKWLYANQYKDEFINTVDYIATFNGKETYSDYLTLPSFRRRSSITIQGKNEEYRKHVYDVFDLVKYKSIRKLSLKNMYLWIISGFSFYGLLLNLEGLTGNIFIDAIVTYSAEIIAEIGSGFLSSSIGRKRTAFFSFALAFIGSLLFCLINLFSLEIIILFLSAMGVASGFNVLYIYSAELFPTNIKSLSVSVFSLFNRLAGGMIPILLTYTRNITIYISILSLGAVIVVISLPESLGYEPGDEVEELRNKVYEEEDGKVRETQNYIYFHEVFDESF